MPSHAYHATCDTQSHATVSCRFDGAAAVLNACEHISFVTAINTVGNGLHIDVDTEAPLLGSMAFGGLGGPAVHAIALGNVRKLRQKLDQRIAVIGCGGVDSGEAAFKHLLCGASGVMVSRALSHASQCPRTRARSEPPSRYSSRAPRALHALTPWHRIARLLPQVASALLHEGPGVFARIEGELLEIMKKKGYKSIAEFQNKLKDS